MTNQTYHIIPEPAGDWQEGDENILRYSRPYRLRPVQAQAGQLWRDLREDDDDDSMLQGDRLVEINDRLVRQRPIPVQACACEGLRAALRKIINTTSLGHINTIACDALAESCPGQQDASKLPNATGTPPCCLHVDSVKWNPFNGVVQCHSCGTIYDARSSQQSGEQPYADDHDEDSIIEQQLKEEIPLDLNLLREINLDDYSVTHTKRRFNRIGGQYFEVNPTHPAYDYAMSGEVILNFKDGLHILDQITIIYSRVGTPCDLSSCKSGTSLQAWSSHPFR